MLVRWAKNLTTTNQTLFIFSNWPCQGSAWCPGRMGGTWTARRAPSCKAAHTPGWDYGAGSCRGRSWWFPASCGSPPQSHSGPAPWGGGNREDVKVNWLHITVVLLIIASLNHCLLVKGGWEKVEENGRRREQGMKIKTEECQLRSKMSLGQGQRGDLISHRSRHGRLSHGGLRSVTNDGWQWRRRGWWEQEKKKHGAKWMTQRDYLQSSSSKAGS